jgi:hypothetical protein
MQVYQREEKQHVVCQAPSRFSLICADMRYEQQDCNVLRHTQFAIQLDTPYKSIGLETTHEVERWLTLEQNFRDSDRKSFSQYKIPYNHANLYKTYILPLFIPTLYVRPGGISPQLPFAHHVPALVKSLYPTPPNGA